MGNVPIFQMSNFGFNGRFGNQIYQHFFMNILKKEIGCDINFPTNSDLFVSNNEIHLSNDVPILDLMGSDRNAGPMYDVQRIKKYIEMHKAPIYDITGWFQYHTSFYRDDKLKNLFYHLYSPVWDGDGINEVPFKNFLRENMEVLGNWLNGRQLLTIHNRRGDYVELEKNGAPFFFAANFDTLLDSVEEIFSSSQLRDVAIYVCSDDLEFCEVALNRHGINAINSNSFFNKKATHPDSILLLDIAAMVMSDFFIAANSTLSIFSAMLNERAKIFMRPDPSGEGLIPFHPWNTPILCHKSIPRVI